MTDLEYDELISNNSKIKNLYYKALSPQTAEMMCSALDNLTLKKLSKHVLSPFSFRKWALDNGFICELKALHCFADLEDQSLSKWLELLLVKFIEDRNKVLATNPEANPEYLLRSINRLHTLCATIK